jgi:hypothetical protein
METIARFYNHAASILLRGRFASQDNVLDHIGQVSSPLVMMYLLSRHGIGSAGEVFLTAG